MVSFEFAAALHSEAAAASLNIVKYKKKQAYL